MNRRDFVRTAGAGILVPAALLGSSMQAEAGLITQSGPRRFTTPGGGGAGAFDTWLAKTGDVWNDNFADKFVYTSPAPWMKSGVNPRTGTLFYPQYATPPGVSWQTQDAVPWTYDTNTDGWDTNGNGDSNMFILPVSAMPSEITGDPNFPSSQVNCLLADLLQDESIGYSTIDISSRGLRTLSIEVLEARVPDHKSGEKFFNVDFSPGAAGEKGMMVLGLRLKADDNTQDHFTYFGNGPANYDDSNWTPPDVNHFYLPGWHGALTLWQMVVYIPLGTSATGYMELWKNDVKVAEVRNIRINEIGDEGPIWKPYLGGWISHTADYPGSLVPVKRYILAWKGNTSRLTMT